MYNIKCQSSIVFTNLCILYIHVLTDFYNVKDIYKMKHINILNTLLLLHYQILFRNEVNTVGG